MAGFYGRRSVLADLMLHQRGTGKVVSAVLTMKDGLDTQVSYANAYAWPSGSNTGAGGKGRAWNTGRVTLWRVGESDAPKADDTLALIIDGEVVDVRINGVTARLNADEADGFAVYDLDYGTT